MSGIRLIGIDLDGTLVVDGAVSQRNVAAIRAATEMGVTVAIATGRPHMSAESFVDQLGLHDVPIISFNGAVIRRPGDGEPLQTAPVPAETAREVVRYCIDRRLHIHYYLGDTMYVTRRSRWALLYQSRTGMEPVPAGDMRRFDGKSPVKILVCVPPDDAVEVLAEGQRLFGDKLLVTRSMPEYVEYLSLEAGKGKALLWLAQRLGIGAEQTMGMGDMLNDLELVQMAGVGVAMPHGQEPVKQAAEFVPGSSTEGVAEAIEKYVLQA